MDRNLINGNHSLRNSAQQITGDKEKLLTKSKEKVNFIPSDQDKRTVESKDKTTDRMGDLRLPDIGHSSKELEMARRSAIDLHDDIEELKVNAEIP